MLGHCRTRKGENALTDRAHVRVSDVDIDAADAEEMATVRLLGVWHVLMERLVDGDRHKVISLIFPPCTTRIWPEDIGSVGFFGSPSLLTFWWH